MSNKRILVFRLSALGDVAMTVPVLWAMSKEYPGVSITFVSKGFAEPLVKDLPNINFFRVDDKKRHSGFLGIIRLFVDLKRLDSWDGIADLHDVLRTKIVRIFFLLLGTKIAVIDKGRSEKKALTRKRNKRLVPLKHSVIRYSDVFKFLGYPLSTVENFNGNFVSKPDISKYSDIVPFPKVGHWVGIAPFAMHKGKMYPTHLMRKVIDDLAAVDSIVILLFGGKGLEQKELMGLAEGRSNIYSMAGVLKLDQELEVMSNLDVMVSMDSANMHLATLSGTPVISIWGATHPFAGFYGWQQDPSNAIQVELYCRPCSVYGNKPCYRGDYACLFQIEPIEISRKVLKTLGM
ncbi:MAG: glycosyltransferase family 9 protein [Bacteroidales bacterium]|nr:glycosyltransferase family 9 protein [Bacteroidales bacterium]MDD3890701.1 glycosyltransferase family 9 protein [Bacteroidales bacterium]